MKRHICLLLILMMFVAMLTGCGDSNEKLSKEFVEHLKGYYDVVDDNTKRDITFKIGRAHV